jgi:predicted Zn-dependent protease
MSISKKHAGVMLLIALATTSVALNACKTTTGAVNKTTEAAARVLLPPSEEVKLGAQLSAETEKELTIHADADVQKYISALGQKVAAAAKGRTPDGITFTFKVVDDPATVNAFAMPGGYIYIYSGLLLKAESEAEVIGVLGHEVAHVTQRHVAERLVAAYGLQTVTDMAIGKNPGQISQIAAGLAANGYLLKYGRDQERESDRVGLSYVLRAGYNPQGMVSFFEKLAAGGPRPPVILSSHPDPADRARELQKLIAKQSSVPKKTGEEEFEAMYPKFKSPAATTPPAEPAPETTTDAETTK